MEATCRPLSFGNIRAPFLPVFGSLSVLFQPLLLLGEVLMAVVDNHFASGVDRRAV